MKSCFVEVTVSRKTCVGYLDWGFFVDLVELSDVTNGGTTLLKTMEAFSGAFFFSTSVELKQRAQGELALKLLTQRRPCFYIDP